MGRKPKFNEPNVILTMRIPESVVNQIPHQMLPSDYFVALAKNQPVDSNQTSELSLELKLAIKTITNFFTQALDIPKFLSSVTEEIETAIGVLEHVN